MDLESLWKSACALLEKKMNYLAYTTWVQDNLYPVVLEDDTLIIGAKMEPLIPMVQKKYISTIENCLSECEGKAIKALILGKNEADHRLTRTKKGEEVLYLSLLKDSALRFKASIPQASSPSRAIARL